MDALGGPLNPAEATTGASHAAESAQCRYIVDAVRLGEINPFVRIVQIRTDLKSQTRSES